MKRLSSSGSSSSHNVGLEESGELLFHGETHTQVRRSIRQLTKLADSGCYSIKIAATIPQYRETVTQHSPQGLAKSANRFNRLYVRSEPLHPALTDRIEGFGESLHSGIVVSQYKKMGGILSSSDDHTGKSFLYDSVHSKADVNERANVLSTEFDWDRKEAKGIWAYAPDATGPNIMVDATKGGYGTPSTEIKDSCIPAFEWGTKEGPLCDSIMRGVRYSLEDFTVYSDAIHRGASQILPATRKGLYGTFLNAQPRLMEPVYLVELEASVESMDGLYALICRECRGEVASDDPAAAFGQQQQEGPLALLRRVTGFVPVEEYEKLSAGLKRLGGFGDSPTADDDDDDEEEERTNIRTATTTARRRAFYVPQTVVSRCAFDHWRIIESDPLLPIDDDDNDCSSSNPKYDAMYRARDIVQGIRARKGLKPAIAKSDFYLDKL